MSFLEFCFKYWRELAACLGFVISLVVNIILLIKKNKGFDVYSKALNKLLIHIPGYIALAETSGLTGKEKKLAVIKMALEDLNDSFGRELTDDEANYMKGLINQFIELVLCTPQKKGARLDGKK